MEIHVFPTWMGPCPRAGVPWNEAEVDELRKEWSYGDAPLHGIAQHHGRAVDEIAFMLNKDYNQGLTTLLKQRAQRLEAERRQAREALERKINPPLVHDPVLDMIDKQEQINSLRGMLSKQEFDINELKRMVKNLGSAITHIQAKRR